MLRMRRVSVVALVLGVLATLTVLFPSGANAQRKLALRKRPFIEPQPTTTVVANADGFNDGITHDTRPEYKDHINAAQDYIREKDWDKAAGALQKLLDNPKNFAVEVTRKDDKTKKESTAWVSVRFEANRLIGLMSKEGLDAYQNNYGGAALKRLDEAKKFSDPKLFAEVAERYMHTDAGGEAMDLLATYFLDRGEFYRAAELYKRLLNIAAKRKKPIEISPLTLFKAALAFRAGAAKADADLAWKQLEPRIRRGGLVVNGQKINAEKLETVLNNVEIPVVLGSKDWPMWRGNPKRNARADASAPLFEASWQHSFIHDDIDEPKTKHPDTEAWVTMAIEAQEKGNEPMPVLPGFHPVAANGKLIYRTYGAVVAIYIKDGEEFGEKHKAGDLAWKSTLEGSLTSLLDTGDFKDLMTNYRRMYGQQLSNIIFENSAVGTLATDRGKVYLVDDLALPPHPQYLQQFMYNGGAPAYPPKMKDMVNGNTLRAYDLESGKLVWQLPDSKDPGELGESHFLGAPLSVGGNLYVLCEKKSELRLLCLDPNKNGQVIRSQVLCGVKSPVTSDYLRRIHTVNLAYGEGILVIPTNAGALLGVDLLTQSLIWSYPYREGAAVSAMPVDPWGRARWGGGPIMALPNLNQTFKNAPPVITKGKVVQAAPDGSSIHCVDLREGRRLWHTKRNEDFYLAGVFDDKVLMVTKNGCRALSLEDGHQIWSLNLGTPSGQGVASNGLYYLPLKNREKQAEVTAIDVAKGTVKAHNRSRKQAAALAGNLLFHEGAMLSQSANTVAAYPQLEVKIREIEAALAKTPEDPYWQTEAGELKLADGKVQDAVDHLRKALASKEIKKDTSDKARLKLYEAFTELFQTKFETASQVYLNEYKDMCKADNQEETNRRQARFLFLMGNGREKQGELIDAYQYYVDFGALPINKERVTMFDDPNHKAPPEVWVRGRIAAMMAKASEEKRKPLEEKIAKEWAGIQVKGDVDALQRFVRTFDVPFKVGREARLKLADTLMEKNDPATFLSIEMLLNELRVPSLKEDAVTRAKAIEGLARLAIRRGTPDSMKDAAKLYGELGRDYPTTKIRDGKTGADFFDELATDKRFLPYLDAAAAIKITGKMKAREVDGNNVQINANLAKYQTAFTFQLTGDAPRFVKKHRLMFSNFNNIRQLILFDRTTNQEYATIPLENLNQYQYWNYLFSYNQNNNLPNASFRFYQAKGHLAMIQIGPMVYCIDIINKKVLWNRNLVDDQTLINLNNQYNLMPDADGHLQIMAYGPQPFTRKIGQIGNLEASYVCLQTQKGLVALDPVTGKELWTKTDVPARTQIFGDDQHIYLVESAGGQAFANARCLRASDGVRVDVPDFAALYQVRKRLIGRNLLVEEKTKEQMVVRLYDAHTGKDLWKKAFEPNAKYLHSPDVDLAGVIESDGKVTVVNLRTSKEVLNAKLESVDIKDLKDPLLLDDGEQFYLALNKPVEVNVVSGGILYNNFATGTPCATVNGVVYAFDRKGKLRWHSMGPIANQLVVLEHFKDMPIVVFTSRFNWMANGNQVFAFLTSLDKKTGKLIWNPDPRAAGNYQFATLSLDPRRRTVELTGIYGQKTVQFYVDGNMPKDGGKTGAVDPKLNNGIQPQPLPRPIRIRGGIGGGIGGGIRIQPIQRQQNK